MESTGRRGATMSSQALTDNPWCPGRICNRPAYGPKLARLASHRRRAAHRCALVRADVVPLLAAARTRATAPVKSRIQRALLTLDAEVCIGVRITCPADRFANECVRWLRGHVSWVDIFTITASV